MNFGRSDDIKRFIGEKAGMDEATTVGLRERIHAGLLPLGKLVYESCRLDLRSFSWTDFFALFFPP